MAINNPSKIILSGSTNGKAIQLTATSFGAANTIHLSTASGTNVDEIWLWAYNSSTSAVAVVIEWGNTGNAWEQVTQTINYQQGLFLVLPGLILNNGVYVKAWASAANVVGIYGFVNQITS
jgi:hypothetical protein